MEVYRETNRIPLSNERQLCKMDAEGEEMKKIYYSYLLNRERDLKKSLGNSFDGMADIKTTIKAAKKMRDDDCYDGANKPGKIVKITLETINQ